MYPIKFDIYNVRVSLLSPGLKHEGLFPVFERKSRSNRVLPKSSLSNFLSGLCNAQNVPEQIFSQDNPGMLFDTLQYVFPL